MACRLLRLPTRRGQVLHAAAQADGRCHQGREAGMGRGQVLHAAAQADGCCHQGTEPGWAEVRSCMLQPRQMAAPIRAQRPGCGEVHYRLKAVLGLTSGQLWQGLWSPAEHSPTCSPSLRQSELEAWGNRPGSTTSLFT